MSLDVGFGCADLLGSRNTLRLAGTSPCRKLDLERSVKVKASRVTQAPPVFSLFLVLFLNTRYQNIINLIPNEITSAGLQLDSGYPGTGKGCRREGHRQSIYRDITRSLLTSLPCARAPLSSPCRLPLLPHPSGAGWQGQKGCTWWARGIPARPGSTGLGETERSPWHTMGLQSPVCQALDFNF